MNENLLKPNEFPTPPTLYLCKWIWIFEFQIFIDIGLHSIYFKIICITHTYMINAGIGFDNKIIMNLILSHLLIIN